jgi:hypothetical protein
LRAKNAAANTVLNTQVKVDENRLRPTVVDKLPELLEILREEEIKYALRRAGGTPRNKCRTCRRSIYR